MAVPQKLEGVLRYLRDELADALTALQSDVADLQAASGGSGSDFIPVYIAPTLDNAWVNYGAAWATAGFYKDPYGRVHLKGLVKDGDVDLPIFTLPVGYRPSEDSIFASDAVAVSTHTETRVDVMANGDVIERYGANAYTSLNGISFLAEDTTVEDAMVVTVDFDTDGLAEVYGASAYGLGVLSSNFGGYAIDIVEVNVTLSPLDVFFHINFAGADPFADALAFYTAFASNTIRIQTSSGYTDLLVSDGVYASDTDIRWPLADDGNFWEDSVGESRTVILI